jgi:hypothetical protein
MPQKQLGELFEELKGITGRGSSEKKVEHLKKFETPTLRYLLRLAFAKDLKWELPEGAPPFKIMKVPMGMGYSNLFAEARKFYLFISPENGGHKTLKGPKREMLFVEMLETLHESDAKLLLAIKDRKVANQYSITEKIALTAFPDLYTKLPPPRV